MHDRVPSGSGESAPATPAQLAAIDAAIARLVDLPGALLPIFHAIQDELGFVPHEAIARAAEALNLSRAEVHGVLTFYHDFRRQPPGRMVLKLCRAEACQTMGCRDLERRLRDVHGVGMGQTAGDGSLTVEPAYCLGNCALSPAALVDGKLVGRLDVARLDGFVHAAKARGGAR